MTTAVETAFGVAARAHLPRLYSIARRLVGADAEDLVQDALLRAFRGYPNLRDAEAAEAWFTRILINCARDRYRRLAVRPETPMDPTEEFSLYRTLVDEDPFPYSDSLHVDFLCLFGNDDVWAVLAALPELYRVPLVLVHMEGMSVRDVASLLEAPRGTLLSRLHRGRKLFERELWSYARTNGLLREVTP